MERAVKRKRNKSRNLLLLVLLALLCIGAYVLVHHFIAKKESSAESAEEESKTKELLQLETEDAVKLIYQYEKQNVVLVKENDTWKLSDDKKYPVDQDLVTSMLAVFSNTSATKTIAEDQKEASEYGMDTPLLTATVVMKDKTETTLTIGMAGIGESSEDYYVTVSGKEGIYMTSSGAYTPFAYGEKQLGVIEETPSISSDAIYAITIRKGENTTFEAKKEIDSESVNYDNWTIVAPYDSAVAGDTTSLSSLASTYTSYSFTENVAYEKKQYETYGLENPAYTVEIKYTEDVEEENSEAETEVSASPSATATATPTKTVKKSFMLYIGSKDGNGNYYVRTSDTDYVYLMSESEVEAYLNVDAFSEVSTTVFAEALSDMKTIEVETKEKTVTYTVDTEKEDEDLTSLYDSITALSYKGEVEDEAKAGEMVLTLKLMYGEDGQDTKKFVFTKQDSNYDQVTEDGKTYFVVDHREVETIISKIK